MGNADVIERRTRSKLRRAAGVLVPMMMITVAVTADALAQTPARLPRIGAVGIGSDEAQVRRYSVWKSLLAGLGDQGMVEGRDYTLDLRFTAGRPELFEPLTQELVKSSVDLIVVGVCGAPLDAARRATQTIPIVVPTCNDDLVELGIVKSFKHPGGNITGMSKLTPQLASKRRELLLQAVPQAKRIAILWNPGYSEFKADWRELRDAARVLGVTLVPFEFRKVDDLEPVFDSIAAERPDALMMFSDQLAYAFAARIAKLATERRLPSMFAFREVPDAGGLMSYGPNIPGMWRQSAKQIARILHGEKAGDLPIEQPTLFELVINRKTANDLGVTIPQSLLRRSDAVVD
ncbi:ABC transporter substrate-binding protein [Variovorax sp. J22P240]|uniref:ABC transporter substrate-binding protein n=1 Tax=Variovorax sp. J22P240 TaxID=3053514 RepID=UPI002574FB76|nr:ABC transporter substrate-binding protein [Variovorax sp. J22P240]MDM0002235.1 ABC transporter substrate-binding protein [Variovorax sp. J22P240]